MSKLRVALIGNGGICRGSHVVNYVDDDRVEVVAFCDIIEERAAALRDKYYPDAAVYTDYKELLKDESIDAVDICTPNYLHSIIAVDAFKAGKHVLCEKPDAIDVTEVLKMKNAADEAGKVLMVIRNNRFATASQYAKKFVDDGKMGEIYCGRCGWQRRRGIPGKGGWFTTKAQSGGGPLIDLGVHMIDLAVWLMGNPTPVAVSANTYTKFADNDTSDSVNSKFGDANAEGTFDVEDLAMGMIRFDNGAVLQIEFSWASNIKEENRFVELRGTKAGLKWKENEVEFFTEDNGQLLDIIPKGKMDTNGHKKNIQNFIDVLTEGAEPVFKPSQGVDMIKILCAIYESAKQGKEVIL
ncbi:MAG: Gfo/Idh/MocA family oxidoreductase [Clostridia bacterium]|nr:Gfo/Idh/MocA family oxidoreductase [Clostridia bacterium]